MDLQQTREVTITARCLCSAHVYTASVPTSALPLRAVCCHCDSCRRMTGGLYFPVTPWPLCRGDASSDGGVDLSQLKRYDFSATIAVFSCAVCSSFLFCRGPGREAALRVVVGVLDDVAVFDGLLPPAPAVVYEAHIFVGDTLDGGASRLLCRSGHGGGAVVARRWRGRNDGASEELVAGWPASGGRMSRALTKGSSAAAPTRLRCVCGGVDFMLRSRAVDPEPGGSRYRAGLCACGSCRLFFGADLTGCAWLPLSHFGFVPTGNGTEDRGRDTFPQDLAALRAAVDDKDGRLGTLRCYESSEHTEHYFCGTCSASVFLATAGHGRLTAAVVGVGVGLLQHAPDEAGGALAEGFLAWDRGAIAGMEDVRSGGWRLGLLSAAAEEWSRC